MTCWSDELTHNHSHHADDVHDHDLGLQHDVNRILTRRRALGLAAATGAGAFLIASAADHAAAQTPMGPPPGGERPMGPPPMSDPQPDVIGVSAGGDECVLHPTETAGPYPADGSNRAHGELANVLTQSGIVREDMRGSFAGATGSVEGVKLALTLHLLDVDNACTPLEGYVVYAWHCDGVGKYSIYDYAEENFLRAVGVSDSAGRIKFTSIVPGCYDGRFPHIHFEVYRNLAEATDYRNRILTSQIAVPSALCESIYTDNPTYEGSLANLGRSPLDTDNIFGDSTEKQLAAQTMSFSATDDGVSGAVTIGVQLS